LVFILFVNFDNNTCGLEQLTKAAAEFMSDVSFFLPNKGTNDLFFRTEAI
jgi:hypothetical protein